MKSLIVSMLAACAVSAAPAQNLPAAPRAQRGAESPAARYARTGGIVEAPAAGKSLVIVDAQAATGAPAAMAEEIHRFFRIPVRLEKAAGPAASAELLAAQGLRGAGAGLAVVVTDSPGAPALLAAPEDRWAAVNLAPLRADSPSSETLEARARKEIIRAFGYAGGAANCGLPGCAMSPIYTLAGLDALKQAAISPGPLPGMYKTMQAVGILPQKVSTYRRACEEGWAPAPTDTVQRAIQESVKKGAAK